MVDLLEQDLSDDQVHQMLKEAELRMKQAAGQMVLNPANTQSDSASMTGLINRWVFWSCLMHWDILTFF